MPLVPVPRFRRAANRHRAFTLVEIMIVVVIIGLLAAMGVPALKASRIKSIATRAGNDMKKLGEAFQTMIFENPAMPSGIYNEGADGTCPAGFNTADLPSIIHRRPLNANSVLSFDLRDALAGPNEGVVVLTATSGVIDPEIMLKIDQVLDNGDLTTGEVRRVSATQMIYRAYTQ